MSSQHDKAESSLHLYVFAPSICLKNSPVASERVLVELSVKMVVVQRIYTSLHHMSAGFHHDVDLLLTSLSCTLRGGSNGVFICCLDIQP